MQPSDEIIEVYDRRTKKTFAEKVPAGRWLRWLYRSGLGQWAREGVVKRAFFSRLVGRWMRRPSSAWRIAPFIQDYGLDPAEFAQAPETFENFNAFFTRRLKPEARPVNDETGAVVLPCDGRHLAFADISQADGVYVKGQRLDMDVLLGDAGLAGRFARGSAVVSRLAPVDYHRVHFPCGGIADAGYQLQGPLYSVNPLSLRLDLRHLLGNRRHITPVYTKEHGTVLLVCIGATCVGSLEDTFTPGEVAKGQEKGFFAFGGSCVVTLFEPGALVLDDDLLEQTAQGRETFARMGETLGRWAGDA